MIFIKRALMDDRALRATIGLSASEFNQLFATKNLGDFL